MVEFNKEKSSSKSKSVDESIKRLIKEGKPINFNTVAKGADVSKSYLYNNPDHRRRIEELRRQQEGRAWKSQTKSQKSDASKDVIVASLKKRVRELENRIYQLETENRKLRGTVYDNA